MADIVCLILMTRLLRDKNRGREKERERLE